jgi:hypothetical protein
LIEVNGTQERYQRNDENGDCRIAVELDLDGREGLLYSADPDHFIFGPPLDTLVFARLLAERRRTIAHAGAVVIDGKGVVFGGVSGAGKTTLTTRLVERGFMALSDERVVVGPDDDGRPTVWGTPWSGTGGFAEPGPAPLHAVFLLEKDGDNTSGALSPAVASARLLSLCTVPYWNPEAAAKVVDGVAETIGATPTAVLRLRDDASSVDFLLGCL